MASEKLRSPFNALIEALEYYADPMTYFGIAMVGDAPHGDFFDDFEKYPWAGDYSIQDKPGRRAREALRGLLDDPKGYEILTAYVETNDQGRPIATTADDSLFSVPGVKEALWLLLGAGLDDAGKEKWLSMRLAEGMEEEAIFADALSYIDGQVAT